MTVLYCHKGRLGQAGRNFCRIGKIKCRYVVAGVAIAAVISMESSQADDHTQDQPESFLALGAALVPEFIGSEESRVVPLLAGRVYKDKRYIEANGTGFRVNIINSGRFAFGPALGVTLNRSDNVESDVIASLPEVDTAVEIGGFAAYTLPIGKNGRTQLTVGQQILFDVTNNHDGLRSTSSIGVGHSFSSRLQVSVNAFVDYVDDDFAKTYFSVPKDIETSLQPFAAGSGANKVGLRVNSLFMFNNNWFVTGLVSYGRLIGDASDSPVVNEEGSRNQAAVGLSIGRSF